MIRFAIARDSAQQAREPTLRVRRSQHLHALGAVAFLVSGLIGGPAANAQPSDAPASPPVTRGAKEHYLRGIEFAEHRQWANALAEFNASLALRPTSAASMNAAYCLQQLGRNADALRLYRAVLSDFDSALVEKERESVRASIAELESNVGHLALKCDVAEATVLIDDETRGKTPLGDLLLDPGLHVVRILKEGYEPAQVSLTIAATQTTQWNVKLWELGDKRPVAAPIEPKPVPPPRRRFVIELQAGLPLYHSLGGGADESCKNDVLVEGTAQLSCPGRNFLSLGFAINARFGYRIQPHIALEVTAGYLRLWHDLERRMRVYDANGQAYDSVRSPDDSWALDQTRVSMPFIGVGASREFFKRTPLLARLTTGIGRATVRTAVNGYFSPESGGTPFVVSVVEDTRVMWIPYLAPEVRMGYRFATTWVADFGIAAWLLWAPGYARSASQVSGTPPEQRWVLRSDSGDPVRLGIESALGAALIVVPSLSVRNEF